MRAEPALVLVQTGGRNPRSSVLIRVDLRCHFLLTEQARNRRKDGVLLLG
jgi:hypothetical protein